TPHDIYAHPATPFVAEFVGGANVLSGHVENGHAALSASLSVPVADGHEGAPVQAFVRPEDVKLRRVPDGDDDGADRVSAARIERLTRIGSGVKVALRLADGAPMTVEMPRADAQALGLAEGDRVLVDLRHAKLFVEDYSI